LSAVISDLRRAAQWHILCRLFILKTPPDLISIAIANYGLAIDRGYFLVTDMEYLIGISQKGDVG
jgi:hypothetical protein